MKHEIGIFSLGAMAMFATMAILGEIDHRRKRKKRKQALMQLLTIDPLHDKPNIARFLDNLEGKAS